MKRYFVSLFWILTLLLAFRVPPAFCNSPEKDPGRVGGNAPQFTVFDVEGNKITLDKLMKSHKAVIVNFWGLRCGACIEEMPHLNEIYKKYVNDIVILGVNVDAVDGDFLKEQIKNIGLSMDYLVVPDPEFIMVDLYQLTAAPLTVVIDSDGVIRYRHENYVPGDEKKLEAVIKSVIDGKKVVSK